MEEEKVGIAVRVDHSDGVANYLKGITSKIDNLKDKYFFFDFDRLLTNGYELSNDEEKAPINKRIRGGEELVDILKIIKDKGANMYIITARSPKTQVIQQLQASLNSGQLELKDCFQYSSEKAEILEFNGAKFATNGQLFATGYQKESAVAYIMSKVDPKTVCNVYFFDDAVTNAYSVLSSWNKDLKTHTKVSLTSVWADPFFEETEAEGEATMVAVHSESTDFNYHSYLKAQLEKFGINEEECKKRRETYIAEEKKYNRKAHKLKEKPPPAKKMNDVEQKFSGLAGLFGKKP